MISDPRRDIFTPLAIGLPPLLHAFLERRDIYKTGVNIDGDGRKLFRDFNIRTNGLLDILAVTKHLPPDTFSMTPRRSLRYLTAILVRFWDDINKLKKTHVVSMYV